MAHGLAVTADGRDLGGALPAVGQQARRGGGEGFAQRCVELADRFPSQRRVGRDHRTQTLGERGRIGYASASMNSKGRASSRLTSAASMPSMLVPEIRPIYRPAMRRHSWCSTVGLRDLRGFHEREAIERGAVCARKSAFSDGAMGSAWGSGTVRGFLCTPAIRYS